MMVAILQLKASKLIVYFMSFTVVIFTILKITYENKYHDQITTFYQFDSIQKVKVTNELLV